MPRITAGEFKGRRLAYPAGRRFRPTMDKVKEAMFSMIGDAIREARVLDLFAAAGGLGLEALSRGARQAVFVEQNRTACRALEENIKSLGVQERCVTACKDVLNYLAQSDYNPTHVFCDPPYVSDLASKTLKLLASYPDISDNTLIVLEHPGDKEILIPPAFRTDKTRKYGETRLTFLTGTKED